MNPLKGNLDGDDQHSDSSIVSPLEMSSPIRPRQPNRATDYLDNSPQLSEQQVTNLSLGENPNSLSESLSQAPRDTQAGEKHATEVSVENFYDKDFFAPGRLNTGDTLVFIDVPDTVEDPRRQTSCDGLSPLSQTLRVHSENFLTLTESKFPQMLNNDVYQTRVKRRRKPDEELMRGIKYVLDLTPPTEGENLVFQMTKLSLTPGIINWWSSKLLHPLVNKRLVDGHDDLCSCKHYKSEHNQLSATSKSTQPHNVDYDSDGDPPFILERLVYPYRETSATKKTELPPKKLPPRPAEMIEMRAKKMNKLFETPQYAKIPQYCPFRHCASIVRLLMVIEGHGVPMDSAHRVWTMVGLCKIFECPSVMRDKVASWIMSNSRFIEVLPEEALIIGFSLQLPQITQSAFRILVNELALEEAAKPGTLPANSRLTVFGRNKGDVGDDLRNMIQHAARSLVERVKSELVFLQKPDLLDFLDLPEWRKIKRMEQALKEEKDGSFSKALRQLQFLIEMLACQVAAKVDRVLAGDDNDRHTSKYLFPEMDQDRATYVEPKNYRLIADILGNSTVTQKQLCPFFYRDISSFGLGPQRTSNYGHTNPNFRDIIRELRQELQQRLVAKPLNKCWHQDREIFFDDGFQTMFLERAIKLPLFDMLALEQQIQHDLKPIMLAHERDADTFGPLLNITRHLLLTLTQNEMRYLPLWAGGNDDGSGGVFETFLPPPLMGANSPGPAYNTGLTVCSVFSIDSLLDDIHVMLARGTTVAGSVDAQESISSVYDRNRVNAGSSTMASEIFSAGDSEFNNARYETPSNYQAVGQSLDVTVESFE